MKAFARLREEKGKVPLSPKLGVGLKLKTPVRQTTSTSTTAKKRREDEEEARDVMEDVPAASAQKRTLKRPAAFQSSVPTAPSKAAATTRRAGRRHRDESDEDDTDTEPQVEDDEEEDEVEEGASRAKNKSKSKNAAQTKRGQKEKKTSARTIKRRNVSSDDDSSISDSSASSDSEETETETKARCGGRTSKAAPAKTKPAPVAPVVVAESEDEDEDGVVEEEIEEVVASAADDLQAHAYEDDHEGDVEADEEMADEEAEEERMDGDQEGEADDDDELTRNESEEDDDDDDDDGEVVVDLASLVISRLEALNLLDAPEPELDAAEHAPTEPVTPAVVDGDATETACEVDPDVADDEDKLEDDNENLVSEDKEIENEEPLCGGAAVDDADIVEATTAEVSVPPVSESKEDALRVVASIDLADEDEDEDEDEAIEPAVGDVAPDQAHYDDDDAAAADDTHETVDASHDAATVDDGTERDSDLDCISDEDKAVDVEPEAEEEACDDEEEEVDEDEEEEEEEKPQSKRSKAVANFFDEEAEEDGEEDEDEDGEQVDDCCTSLEDDEDESNHADSADEDSCQAQAEDEDCESRRGPRGGERHRHRHKHASDSEEEEEDSEEDGDDAGEGEDEEPEARGVTRMRPEVDERKKGLERLRQKLLARKQAQGLTPLRKTKKNTTKRSDGESEDSSDDGVEIGGKRLRARAGRVQRLKRQGTGESASSSHASTAPPSKNEDELLASLFGDLKLDNGNASKKDKSDDVGRDVVPPQQAKKPIEKVASPPWYTKPGALASVKYSRPAAKPDTSKTPSGSAKAASSCAPAKIETKTVTIELLSSDEDDDEEKDYKPIAIRRKNEREDLAQADKARKEKEERATPAPSDGPKRQEASNAAKKEELKRKMEELKRRKAALEIAKRKQQLQLRSKPPQQQQLPVQDDSSDSDSASDSDEESASRLGSSSSDSEDDRLDLDRTPPSGASHGGVSATTTPSFVRTVKGAMIATPSPSPATPRRPATGNKENVAPGVSGNLFHKQKEELTARLFKEYNKRIFDDQLPADMPITWAVRLTKTAGRTICKRKAGVQSAAIELSVKVLTEYKRLRNTLCHELCHAATWLLDNSVNPPHGSLFFKWARKAERIYPDLNIKTCHSYDIECKYQYQCTNATCGAIVGRHSKSVDLETKRCGKCMGKLRLLPKLKKDGTPANSAPNAYALFMKENFARIKLANPNTPTKEVMKLVSVAYQESKQQAKAGGNNGEIVRSDPMACPSPYVPRLQRK